MAAAGDEQRERGGGDADGSAAGQVDDQQAPPVRREQPAAGAGPHPGGDAATVTRRGEALRLDGLAHASMLVPPGGVPAA